MTSTRIILSLFQSSFLSPVLHAPRRTDQTCSVLVIFPLEECWECCTLPPGNEMKPGGILMIWLRCLLPVHYRMYHSVTFLKFATTPRSFLMGTYLPHRCVFFQCTANFYEFRRSFQWSRCCVFLFSSHAFSQSSLRAPEIHSSSPPIPNSTPQTFSVPTHSTHN